MFKQVAIGIGAMAFAALASASSANAHNPRSVRFLLQDQGFEQIRFLKRTPTFRLKACRGSSKFRINVNFDGEITKCVRVGRCSDSAFDDRFRDDFRARNRIRSRFDRGFRDRRRFRNRVFFSRRFRDRS